MQHTIKKLELRTRRIQVSKPSPELDRSIHAPNDVAAAASALLGDETQEVFLVFHLNIKNKILGYTEAARGSLDQCAVDLRVVFRTAILLGASHIIVAHCHPSGNPEPSTDDRTLTTRLVESGKLLGIQLLDHIIVGDDQLFSFKQENLL